MRKRVVDAHRRVFGQDNPVDGVKVEYLVADMAEANRLDPIWARISTVLYWLGPCDDETPRAARGHARTYIRLARALVAAVLIAAPERISDGSP